VLVILDTSRISTHVAILCGHFREVLKLLLQFGLFISQLGVFMENTIAVPDDVVQLIKELAIGTAEVDNLGPKLIQLLLLSHTWSSGRLPIGYHPSPLALFCKAALIIIGLVWIGFVTNWKTSFMHQLCNFLVRCRVRCQKVAILEEEVICSYMVMRVERSAVWNTSNLGRVRVHSELWNGGKTGLWKEAGGWWGEFIVCKVMEMYRTHIYNTEIPFLCFLYVKKPRTTKELSYPWDWDCQMSW
jgi:hypothetical protein